MITVADLSSLKLKGTISQGALPYIKKGDTVDLFIDIYPDRTFTGVITEIGSMSVSTGAYSPSRSAWKIRKTLRRVFPPMPRSGQGNGTSDCSGFGGSGKQRGKTIFSFYRTESQNRQRC